MRNIPHEIRDDNWVGYAATFPIAFAQVREDPLIDQWVERQLPAASHGIMIASGGCTAALLASSNKFERLTLVDMNLAQLELAKVKIALLCDYEPSERLGLLGHRNQSSETAQGSGLQFDELKRLQIKADVFGPIETVSMVGFDYVGKYELLFGRLQHVLSDTRSTEVLLGLNDPSEQMNFLRINPTYLERLESALSEVMALPNLVRLFGVEATQNSVLPFAEHFLKRTLYAIETFPAASNPYLAQFLLGKFTKRACYPWLDLPQQQLHTQVKYKHSAMAQELHESVEQFDFIHLSNILDWLNKEDAKSLLELASTRLKKGGWLIIRQLNSNLPIVDLCRSLGWQQEIAAKLQAKDRSFFYQKLHIARKE